MSYVPSSAEVREHVRVQVAVAAETADEITEDAAYIFELDEAAVAPLVEEALRDRERATASWPSVTDCDRLDAAFIDLERSGVIARQHFTCCNTCGHAEIHDHVHDALEHGRQVDGYAFYHRQDSERAITEGVLHLRYSPEVGPRVVEALRAHGFAPDWDGNAGRTIQIPIEWRRRAWQRHAPPAETAQTLLTRWCDAIVRASASDLAAALQGSYLQSLVEVGCLDTAFAWARAPLASPGMLTRSSALATLATALAGRVPRDRVDEVWIEAIACAPYGRSTTLIELLGVADLAQPAVRAAARDRALRTRDDMYGAAAVAWYHACAAQPVDDGTMRRLQQYVERDDARFAYDQVARAALAAAMWVLRTRRGEPGEAAYAVALEVLEALDHDRGTGEAIVARARAMLGPAEPVESVESVESVEPVTLEEAEAKLAAIRDGYDEGLYTPDELREARLAVARRCAAHGQLDRARAMLAEVAAEAREALVTADREIRAFVEAVHAGTRAPDLLITDVEQPALDKAIKRWTAATDRYARLRARRMGTVILKAAAAHAKRDVDRARELATLVLAHEDSLGYLDDTAVATAWIVLGELERAIEYARYARSESNGPIAIALAQRGRSSEAIAHLEKAFERWRYRDATAALAPAILAVSGDPRAAAATMLDAWARADAGLAALSP